jgi:hypothetical protein
VADSVGEGALISDVAEDRVTVDGPGEGDGAGAHEETINAARNPMPADRRMPYAFERLIVDMGRLTGKRVASRIHRVLTTQVRRR